MKEDNFNGMEVPLERSGLMICFGATVVIRQKFSVRNFWKDCIRYDCNVS